MFAALLETALNEDLMMIGFKPARRGLGGGAKVIARVSACSPYSSEMKIDVWVSPVGKKWGEMNRLVAALKAKLPAEIIRTKGAEFSAGRDEGKVCTGLAEIGIWDEQNSYSDDVYGGVRADRDEMAKVVVDIFKDVFRGESISGSNGEYSFRISTHSIGD